MDSGEDRHSGGESGGVGCLGEKTFGEELCDHGKVVRASEEFEELFVGADFLLEGLDVLVEVLAVVVWADVDEASHALSVIRVTAQEVHRWQIKIKTTRRAL